MKMGKDEDEKEWYWCGKEVVQQHKNWTSVRCLGFVKRQIQESTLSLRTRQIRVEYGSRDVFTGHKVSFRVLEKEGSRESERAPDGRRRRQSG